MDELGNVIHWLCEATTRTLADYDISQDPMYLIFDVSRLLHSLLLVPSFPTDSLTQLLECIGVLTNLQEMEETGFDTVSPQPMVVSTGSRGRPAYEIPAEQLEHLLNIGFTCPAIATLFGVSLRTIRNRMSEMGLSVRGLYTLIDDSELDATVRDIKQIFPSCGYRMMLGHLRSRGVRVSQMRVRESLNRIDPVGVFLRRSCSIQRRTYNVSSPLALWHIDGNHKLIR